MAQLLQQLMRGSDEELSEAVELGLKAEIGSAALALATALETALLKGADDPICGAALDEVMSSLDEISNYCWHLVFMGAESSDKGLMVGGIFSLPISLGLCVAEVDSQPDPLGPLFKRLGLVTLGLEAEVERDQMERFLRVVSTRRPADEAAKPTCLRAGDVLDAGVHAICLLSRQDVLTPHPLPPWPLLATFSGLACRLKHMDRYAELTHQNPEMLRSTWVGEAAQLNLSLPALLELLDHHACIINASVSLSELDLPESWLAAIPPTLLRRFMRDALAGIERADQALLANDDRFQGRLRAFLRFGAPLLAEYLDGDLIKLYGALLRQSICALDELPANVQNVLDLGDLITEIGEKPQLHVLKVRSLRDIEAFRQHATRDVLVVGELIRRRWLGVACSLVEAYAELASGARPCDATIRDYAGRALEVMACGATFQSLLEVLATADVDDREHPLRLLSIWRARALPYLIHRLETSFPQPQQQRQLVKVIGHLADDRLEEVTAALRQAHRPFGFYKGLLDVLARSKREAEAGSAVMEFVDLTTAIELRLAGLAALTRLNREEGEQRLLAELDRAAPPVKRKVLAVLADVHCQAPAYGRWLRLVLRQAAEQCGAGENPDDTGEVPLDLLATACNGLAGLLENGQLEVTDHLERDTLAVTEYLLASLRDSDIGNEGRSRTGALLGCVGILQQVGTSESLSVLRRVRERGDEDAARRALRAMETISERMGQGEEAASGLRRIWRALRKGQRRA